MGKWTWEELVSGGYYERDGAGVPIDDILHILNGHEKMLAALEEIAESPHRSYKNKEGNYEIGVADGHLFCANVAKAALWVAKGSAS